MLLQLIWWPSLIRNAPLPTPESAVFSKIELLTWMLFGIHLSAFEAVSSPASSSIVTTMPFWLLMNCDSVILMFEFA